MKEETNNTQRGYNVFVSNKTHNYFFAFPLEMPWKKENKMGKETLTIPEENLLKTVKIIRAGLDHLISEHEISYSDETYIQLANWCEEMWEHIKGE